VNDPAADDPGLGAGDVTFAIVLILGALLVGMTHFTFVAFACSGDTSECARSTKKDGYYEGTLHYLDGRPYRSAEVEVGFASRKSDSAIAFETDPSGRLCIVWANERVYPQARTPTGEPLKGDGAGASGLAPWHELNGGDPPPGCQESSEGIPWNHADDAEATWQSRLLILLPLASIALLVAALIGRRHDAALRLLAIGGLLFGADLIAFVALWFV
jgi:hypothetical protein